MRTTILRSSAFAAIFVLPLVSAVSTAKADGTINRLFRWTGYGWSCGYHACNNHGWSVRDGLPPVGNTAIKKQASSHGKFELVDPNHTIAHPAGYVIHGHHHANFAPQNFIDSGYLQSMPMHNVGDNVGGSLVMPPQAVTKGVFQPYQSAIPPKSPKVSATDAEEKKAVSPSDLEVLPSPKGESDELDDLLLEDNSAQLVPPRNRSARQRVGSSAR